MDKHTKGQWKIVDNRKTKGACWTITTSDRIPHTLASVAVRLDDSEANARRIVAAVNACEGISTEALEAGAVRDMLDALKEAEAFIDAQVGVERVELQLRIRAAIARATKGE